ncbi:glucosyltransferase domain-containing protein [Clostridiaceae bacterium OttesenSCG-928-D20]|nr:glucosyltransferase domain-containing protein [Clostridiaceae bacterium OttesenSCG-928-D20]
MLKRFKALSAGGDLEKKHLIKSLPKGDALLFLTVLSLLLLRYFWRGVAYFPHLDDYIQYHNYRSYYGTVAKAVSDLGLLKARPFAGVLDVGFWSLFWSNLWLTVIIIALLYVLSAMFLKKVFSRYFPVSDLFVIIFCLIPFGFEPFYWLSAASRIVVGLFFASASLLLFQQFLDRGSAIRILGSLLLQLVSFGFYEQALVFSLAATFLIAILALLNKNKRAYFALLSLLNILIFFGITSLQSASVLYDKRMNLVLPFMGEGFLQNLKGCLKQLLAGAASCLAICFVSPIRALSKLWEYKAFLPVLILAAISFVYYKRLKKPDGEEKSRTDFAKGIVFSILLTAAPISIFFVLKDQSIPLRNLAFSFVGLSMLVDLLLSRLIKSEKIIRVLSVIIIVFFTLGSFFELDSIKISFDNDDRAAEVLYKYDFPESSAVIGLEPYWENKQVFSSLEQLPSSCSSSWSLTGMLRCKSLNHSFPMLTPISERRPYYGWLKEVNLLSNFEHVFHYSEGSLTALDVKAIDETSFELYSNGQLYAVMYEENGEGIFQKIG